MSKSLTNRLWSKGALAAATVTAAAVGITGLASASSISNTGPGSYNSIGGGYSSDWQGHQNWSWNDDDWDRECKHWNPHHLTKHDYGNQQAWYKKHDNNKGHSTQYAQWDDNEHKGNYGHENDWNKDHNYSSNDDYDKNKGHEYGSNWNSGGNGGGYDNYGGHGNGGQNTRVSYDNQENYSVRNNNNVSLHNNVDQVAVSGDATSSYNTDGGSVTSGNAYNESNNDFQVAVDNSTTLPTSGGSGGSGSNWADISHTGYGSNNNYSFSNQVDYNVTNNTTVNVNNNVSQTAVSGDATSKYNTWGGNVTSGDAMNVSNNSFVVNVKN